MQSMVLETPGQELLAIDLPTPRPGKHELLIRVGACGICRTDLHVIDGDLPQPKLPLVLGHEIVGKVAGLGAAVQGFVQHGPAHRQAGSAPEARIGNDAALDVADAVEGECRG